MFPLVFSLNEKKAGVDMNIQERGVLTVLSGFSGSGKGTIVQELLRQHPDEFALSISATTRSPREGEQDGREYFFKTGEEFEEMIRRGELLEYAKYVDHYYGTPKAYVEQKLAENKNVILEIEIQGALKIREQYPDALLLFVTPPSAEELKSRLVGRGTETLEVIEARLQRAAEEAEGVEAYDYLVINDDLQTCVDEVYHIIKSAKRRMQSNLQRIEQMREELEKFRKH